MTYTVKYRAGNKCRWFRLGTFVQIHLEDMVRGQQSIACSNNLIVDKLAPCEYICFVFKEF